MHSIIAPWSHPRYMSTATERITRERGNLNCFHVPFIYDYYINRKVRVMPHFEAEESHPTRYQAVRDFHLSEISDSLVFIKDMSCYVMPHILEDEDFELCPKVGDGP